MGKENLVINRRQQKNLANLMTEYKKQKGHAATNKDSDFPPSIRNWKPKIKNNLEKETFSDENIIPESFFRLVERTIKIPTDSLKEDEIEFKVTMENHFSHSISEDYKGLSLNIRLTHDAKEHFIAFEKLHSGSYLFARESGFWKGCLLVSELTIGRATDKGVATILRTPLPDDTEGEGKDKKIKKYRTHTMFGYAIPSEKGAFFVMEGFQKPHEFATFHLNLLRRNAIGDDAVMGEMLCEAYNQVSNLRVMPSICVAIKAVDEIYQQGAYQKQIKYYDEYPKDELPEAALHIAIRPLLDRYFEERPPNKTSEDILGMIPAERLHKGLMKKFEEILGASAEKSEILPHYVENLLNFYNEAVEKLHSLGDKNLKPLSAKEILSGNRNIT